MSMNFPSISGIIYYTSSPPQVASCKLQFLKLLHKISQKKLPLVAEKLLEKSRKLLLKKEVTGSRLLVLSLTIGSLES